MSIARVVKPAIKPSVTLHKTIKKVEDQVNRLRDYPQKNHQGNHQTFLPLIFRLYYPCLIFIIFPLHLVTLDFN